MTAELLIRERLVGQLPEVGERVYPLRAPLNTPLPLLTYARISGAPLVTHSGPAGVENFRLQVQVWHDRYADMLRLAHRVHLTLDGWKAGTIQAVLPLSDGDQLEPETGLSFRVLEFNVWAA